MSENKRRFLVWCETEWRPKWAFIRPAVVGPYTLCEFMGGQWVTYR